VSSLWAEKDEMVGRLLAGQPALDVPRPESAPR